MTIPAQPLHHQPLMHGETVVLRAPSQAWSAPDGSMGSAAIHGVYSGDVRIVSALALRIDGRAVEHIATLPRGADSAVFVSLARSLDAGGADPDVRIEHARTATTTGFDESLVVRSRLAEARRVRVSLALLPDSAAMDRIKAGLGLDAPASVAVIDESTVRWTGSVTTTLSAAGGAIAVDPAGGITVDWVVDVPARGEAGVAWRILAEDPTAVAHGVVDPPTWDTPRLEVGDDRLGRWIDRALDDLDALRLTTTAAPGEVFLAAGAPWFFTLFGRDSLWAARFLLPVDVRLAGSTLRVLARLQGHDDVPDSAEEPGKIMHELRRQALSIPGEHVELPPLYYGTVDATPLWACLLHDAWRWGMPEDEVRELLPALEAALAWMRDYGDADGDGLLEYVDRSGHGLANQGWKDSGDSVQWRDGTLARGPIALCEVQAYAYEAATHGADLLEHFGVGEPGEWRAWAARLRQRFAESFWVDDPAGAYPAIALDAGKRPVDTVTSNLGHLLGTGLLDSDEAALVARRLGSPELDSGFGLRTMSTDSAGYWPLGYHGGTVWTHDTAIAIAGLVAEGHHETARPLIEGLLAAAVAFDYRMPELHSGDSARDVSRPIPYPAACRPQAWSAAAAVSVLSSALGLRVGADGIEASPATLLGPLAVSGLRFRGRRLSVAAGGVVTFDD